MQKIPTLFRRDPDDMRRVLPEVHPGCQWVLNGEGVATRKYDGTCVMFDGAAWWARREVKPGKQPPSGFVEVERDETTGKTVGWEPVEQSGFARWHAEAVAGMTGMAEFARIVGHDGLRPGTYELCGPKINGNPEGYAAHVLVPHANPDVLDDAPRDYDKLRAYLLDGFRFEGIVWHHPDGRMAKLKRRDFT